MALGGSHKGNGSSGSRGRPYGLMLLLAFGAALLGVMVLHKVRERRIFNLLVKDKDHELISLHLLLQKEREHTKEMKRKAEEMKAKIYSLRNQKMELGRRILEMQSTIDSLKDEQNTIETALEEKQAEIKMLRQMNENAEKENLHMVALKESLKQKEAEIEDLKRHLENPVKIWSVSTDDPSSPPVNLTVASNMVHRDGIEIRESKEEGVHFHGSTNDSNGANSTVGNGSVDTFPDPGKGEDTAAVESGNESRAGVTDRTEVSREGQLQTLESSLEGSRNASAIGLDNNQLYKSESSRDNNAYNVREENSASNVIERTVRRAGRASEMVDTESDQKLKDDENKVTREEQLGLENAREAEDIQETLRGGMKLEMVDNSRRASKGKEKHSYASRIRGKRWRILAKNRLLENNRNQENNGFENIRSRKFTGDDQNELVGRDEVRASSGRKTKKERGMGEKFSRVENAIDSSNPKSLKHQNPEDSKDQRNKLVEDDIDHRTEKVDWPRIRPRISHDSKVLTNGSLDGKANEITRSARKESLDEGPQHEDPEVGDVEQGKDISNRNSKESTAEREVKHERPEEMEATDTEDEADARAGDFDRGSVTHFEEDEEEYREETDESEF